MYHNSNPTENLKYASDSSDKAIIQNEGGLRFFYNFQ